MKNRNLLPSIAVSIVLALSIYVGLSNVRDITSGITFGQRLVGITATAYGAVAIAALFAVWSQHPSVWPVVVLWASLVVITAIAATIVYASGLWANVSGGLIALALVTPVVWYARTIRRQH